MLNMVQESSSYIPAALFQSSAQFFHSPKVLGDYPVPFITELTLSIKIAALEILKFPASKRTHSE